MLTSAQVAVGAYRTPDGGLYANLNDVPLNDVGLRCIREVIGYTLDEEQSMQAEGYDWVSDSSRENDFGLTDDEVQEKHRECEPALFDEVGNVLRETYHSHHDSEVPSRNNAS